MRAKSLLPLLVLLIATGCNCGKSNTGDETPLLTPDGGGFCGDRRVEAPEQCDDGNRADGDGCSSTCTSELPSSCAPEAIVDLFDAGVQNGVFMAYAGTTQNHRNELEPPTGCQDDMGGGGPEVVHRLTLPVKADLVLSTANGVSRLDTVLYQLDACTVGKAPDNAACNDDVSAQNKLYQSQLLTPALDPGDRFIVVDSYNLAASALGDYQLDLRVRPIFGEGGGCDPNMLANRCDDGFVCTAETKKCTLGAAPVLDTLEYFNLGGNSVRLVMKGSDVNADVTDYILELLDNVGQPINVGGQTNFPLSFDEPVLGQTTFTASGSISFGASQLSLPPSQARVRLRDRSNFEGATKTATLAPLPERAATEACDFKKLSDRCAAGSYCKETTPGGGAATCEAGTAPTLNGAKALIALDTSRRVTVDATDPEGDIVAMVVTFKNAQGTAVPIDADGNSSVESPSMLPFTEQSGTMTFAGRTDLTGQLFPATTTITQVSVKVRDGSGLESAELTVPFASLPAVPTGSPCDVRRWENVCTSASFVCEAGSATCSDRTASITAACGAAQTLTLGTPVTAALTLGADRWRPPTSCSEQGGGAGSEKVFSFTTTTVTDIRFTTDFPETELDTVVYLADSCGPTLQVTGCSDDVNFNAGNVKSDGLARNVQPGTHYLIVDTWPQGKPGIGAGNVKLQVTAAPILAAGAACDPVLRDNRCAPPLRCLPNAGWTAFTCG